ncbi:protein FAR1-RELATED SEQUENCE 5-like [Citrus sinensis]|uniref:protein FAR1-RELATED SEQUENCE 5-like n=1 Tax=Citrus sinensis TaxID=2711 RepID=UPI00076367AE|nr:protein FAR1-RELATED SEQUENCE 5-like [Citrus sinensis]
MDHSNSGKEALEGIGNDGELKVGMEVKSDAEAYNLCNNYAFRKGFSLRKGHVRRDASGNIRQRDFVCSKEGFPVDEDLCDAKRCNRLETRTGCKALIRFTVSNGVWMISHINFEHNHELAKPEERQFLRSCRKIFEASGGVDVGRRRTKPVSYLGNDFGGDRNVQFAKKDMENYLPREMGNMMEPGDAQSLLNYFRRKKCEDPSFFYAVQILFQQILTLSEGVTDTVFHQVSTKRMDVISFVQHFEEKTKEMHLDELEDDHFCKHVVPRLQVWNGILNHAVYVYTSKIFNFFEMELLGCMGVRMKEVCKDGEVCIYEAIEEAQQKVCKINYNLSTQDISCSCKLFERMGILCRHAPKAFDFNNLTQIPVQYILKRWTKEAKKGIVVRVSNERHGLSSNTVKSVQSLRLSELMHMGSNVYSIASLSDSGTKIVKEKLAEAMELLEKDEEIVNRLAHAKKVDSSPSLNAISDIWTMASLSQV